MKYPDHPLAEIFPLMGAAELKPLTDDIAANGLNSPIVLFDGKILDGRNRYRACELAGVKPRFRMHHEGDALKFVVSANLHRRHLTEDQRAAVAAHLAKGQRGGDRRSDQTANRQFDPPTVDEVAKALKVSPRSVAKAKAVMRANPTLADKVLAGKVSLREAVKKVDADAKKSAPARVDHTGHVIPEGMLPEWERAEAYGSTIRDLEAIARGIAAAMDTQDGTSDSDAIFREVKNVTLSNLRAVIGDLKRVLPYAVCQCEKSCQLCKGRGWLSKFLWDTCVPETVKKIRAAKAKK